MMLSHAIRTIAVALALIVVACAASEQTAERDGSSIEQAIVLEGVTNEIDGVRAEHAETARRFPGWQWESQGLLSPANGRHYDVITLSKGGETKTIYFDITDWFGKFE